MWYPHNLRPGSTINCHRPSPLLHSLAVLVGSTASIIY
nr:MAG TPA: hypothetical protein [Caudoviricetes sp.]